MLDLAQERNELHSLIDHLSPRQLVAVRGLLDAMLDPFERKLAGAGMDDEPLTDEERREIEASREWFQHNEGIPFEQVVAELGFTMDEVRNYQDPEEGNGKDRS
ncbi:MAG: hypothetical protein IPM24_06325 [Bryobacterales bacterium]|nr:hypothetical protein [Bryobacterales bacterium]